jgi:hypothetical protein
MGVGVLGSGFNLTWQPTAQIQEARFLLRLTLAPFLWTLPAWAPHRHNCLQLNWMAQLKKPVLRYLVISEVMCFWGALEYMPTCGYNQLHSRERQGGSRQHSVLIIPTPWVKVKEAVDRDQCHVPNAGNYKATDECPFIETRSPTPPALQWLRPTASQSPHTTEAQLTWSLWGAAFHTTTSPVCAARYPTLQSRQHVWLLHANSTLTTVCSSSPHIITLLHLQCFTILVLQDFFFFLIQNHRMQKQPNDFAEHSNESTNESRTLLGTNYTDRWPPDISKIYIKKSPMNRLTSYTLAFHLLKEFPLGHSFKLNLDCVISDCSLGYGELRRPSMHCINQPL